MILEILLLCIVVGLGFLYYKQDSLIKEQLDYIDKLQDTVIQTYQSISDSYDKMKSIDDKGGFESDDEVGQIFNNLKDVLRELNDDLQNRE